MRSLALTVVLLLPLSAPALDDIKTGTNGASGSSGESVSANASSGDATNRASATGGQSGGEPGVGGDANATANTTSAGTDPASSQATAVGGDCSTSYFSQTGYRGGHASAHAEGSSLTAPALTVTAAATGGRGSTGNNAAGGPAGDATVSASGSLQSGGPLAVTATALTGNGGDTRNFAVPAGASGALNFGLVRGDSLGDATVTARGVGGNGGSFSMSFGGPFASKGADGRSVSLNNVVTGSAGGTLTLVQEATGGNAGGTFRGNDFGLAGVGSSLIDQTAAPGTPVLDARALGQGGRGSNLSGSGVILGISPGGLGNAVSKARNNSGRALATATGLGGATLSGGPSGGTGGAATATALAAGLTTAASLGSSAAATATGAPGTAGSSGGGPGGQADADATAQTTGDGATSAVALATAGNAVSSSSTGSGAPATAMADGSASGAAPLIVTAQATGGSYSNPTGASGAATALATGATLGSAAILAKADSGTTANLAGVALSSATGTAASGSITANAGASRTPPAGSPAASARAIASGLPLHAARAEARAEFAATAFSPSTQPQVGAAANAAPAAAAVNAALNGNPGSAARFDTTKPVQLLLLASAGAQAPVGASGPMTASTQLSVAADTNGISPSSDRQNLLLALVRPVFTGGGPDAVRLRVVREGVTIHDVTLAGSAAASAYFTDRVLDFGPIPAGVSGNLDVDLLLDVTASQPGAGFFATFFLGNAAPAAVQTVDQWRVTYFGSGATNAGPAADDANPTGDGYSNLLKYALGLNPNVACPPGMGMVLDTATGRLRLTIDRSPSTSGIALTVEGTDDLTGAWSTTGLTLEEDSPTRLRVSDDTPLAPGLQRWLRLRVIRF